MGLFQLDTARFLTVYVVQLGMGIVYFIMGLIILKRDTKRLNKIFSSFYIISASATFVNVIYVSLTVNPLVMYLHIITVYLFCFATINLLIFNLILLKSEKVFDRQKQNIVIVIYGVLLLGLFFIPNGVTIDASTEWKPVWALSFLIYSIIIVTSFSTFPVTYYSIKVYKEIDDKELRKKWAFNIISILVYFAIFYLTSISNYLNNPTFRLVTSIAGLSLYATAYLLYYSVGRQIEK